MIVKIYNLKTLHILGLKRFLNSNYLHLFILICLSKDFMKSWIFPVNHYATDTFTLKLLFVINWKRKLILSLLQLPFGMCIGRLCVDLMKTKLIISRYTYSTARMLLSNHHTETTCILGGVLVEFSLKINIEGIQNEHPPYSILRINVKCTFLLFEWKM